MAQQIVEYFKTQPVVKVWIFGSFARGEENGITLFFVGPHRACPCEFLRRTQRVCPHEF